MSEKNVSPDASHIENAQGPAPSAPTMQPAITLTPEQYERLFFQPSASQMDKSREFASRFGNPTLVGLVTFLLVLSPTSWILMQANNTTTTSLAVLVGPFFFLGGMGNFVAGLLEWFIGNTFPFVVFASFGGFWLSLGILLNPENAIPSAFPNGGASAIDFNTGVTFYFIFWSVLCSLYFFASLRTNVGFAVIFLGLIFGFVFLAAAYDRVGYGNLDRARTYFKVAGAFTFVTCVSGWYLAASLLLASVNMPFSLPVGDLSTRFLVKKQRY
ncbi:GPR1/FUN34/yaaH family-domain-containing protein [Vararia minispora EC-137]|uniref:GPR1/FUN34/yaaH family-domain-containing protein n=1 Tax=Vararia minispora EC-137 TaxID=1314806 RepID=A0ACB8Q8V7_9AGAM|nr:GPR1/FUN34/yaaH family-domain-containing protein [Vararia minispora EC-137]